MHHIGRWLTAALVAVVLLPVTANADSATVQFLDGAGKNDPAIGLGRTIKITASSTSAKYLFVRWRNAGGPACAPSPATDPGKTSYMPSSGYYFGTGSSSWTNTVIWDANPGTYTFCMWLSTGGYPSDAAPSIRQDVTFRSPQASLSGAVTPSQPQPGQAASVTVTGATEVPTKLFVRVNPLGSACAPTAETDSGEYINDLYGQSVSGTQTLTARITAPAKAGQYTLCLWLADYSSSTPVFGPQQIPFNVIAPAVTRIVWGPSTVIKVRRPLVVTGRVVSTGRAVGTCHLQRYVSRRWTSVARRVVAVNGTCRMTVKFGRVGREQVRIRFVSASPKRFKSSGTAYRVVRVVR